MKKLFQILTTVFLFAFGANVLFSQHLFTVNQNDLSKENVLQLKTQVAKAEISALSFYRNNENKEVYPITFSSVQNTKIIILNEQTGNNVVITPVEESLTEFQLSPFFMEEMRQATLGNATHYLVMEVANDFSLRSVSSVSVATEAVYIPKYFYGKKENIKEALPQERQILHIFKEKPQLILAYPEDLELQQYAATYEEAMSYYVYMYQLPDGGLTIYDEHFNPEYRSERSVSIVPGPLQFNLTAINMDATKIDATEYALGLWGTKLASDVPIDISVEFKNLGGGGVIGQSFHMQNFLNSAQMPGNPTSTWFHKSLWNSIIGYNAGTGLDIKIEMNTNFNFYFGISGNPGSNQIDWITTMLHEVCHGLGFSPNCQQDGRFFAVTDPDGSYGNYTNYPGIFDRQLFQGATGTIYFSELDQSQRSALLKSGNSQGNNGNLFAGTLESHLVTANGGNRVSLYLPSTYQGGSSVSHWASNVSFPTFMRYYIDWGASGKNHNISERKVGFMKDLGWKTQEGSNAVYASFNPNNGIGVMSYQQFASGISQTLRANIYTREGYTFKNWSTQQDGGGTTYNDLQSISITADVVLYAQWQGANYTLSFNANGGSVDPTSKQVTFYSPIGTLPIPIKPGFTFLNWKIGSSVITQNSLWIYSTNMTADAYWDGSTHTITATAGEGGVISPSGTATVDEGSNKTYTITPDEDFIILDVLVNDLSVGAVAAYTFENIKASHTIHAEFKNISGIKETKTIAALQIIPNPASNSIELRITNYELQINNIEFYNIFGQLVKTVPFERDIHLGNTSQKINISDISAGIYMVKVGYETAKLVVK